MPIRLRRRTLAAIEPQITQAHEMHAAGATPAEIVHECGEWAAQAIGIDTSAVPKRLPAIQPPARYRKRYGWELPRT